MSILQFPFSADLAAEMSCIICGRALSLDEATLGPKNAEGEVTILCNGHLWDGASFINGLADYAAIERRKYFHTHGNDEMLFGEERYA